jgi:hypothetical protein
VLALRSRVGFSWLTAGDVSVIWISRQIRDEIFVNQLAWMRRSHGHQPARMSLNYVDKLTWMSLTLCISYSKMSLKLCRSACMDEFEFMCMSRHRRVRVHVDQQTQKIWNLCRSAGMDEFEFM